MGAVPALSGYGWSVFHAEKMQGRWNRRPLVPSAFTVSPTLEAATAERTGLPDVATETLKREILGLLAPHGDPALGVPASVQDQVPQALATAATLCTVHGSQNGWTNTPEVVQ